MKVQAIVNNWIVVKQGNGLVIRRQGDSTRDDSPLEICVRTGFDGELAIEVHKDGVIDPVFSARVEE